MMRMSKLILGLMGMTLVTTEVVAFSNGDPPDPAPECVTVTVLDNEEVGEVCDCFGAPGLGRTTGEQCFVVCGSTHFCQVCTADAISISGPYDVFWRNFTYSPEFLDTTGGHNVTVTWETPSCVDPNMNGCAEDFVTVTATVRVTIVLDECGSCQPDNAVWACNTYSPPPSGLVVAPPSAWSFDNHHKFEFERELISQGDGRSGCERIENRYRLIGHANGLFGGVDIYDSKWLYKNESGGYQKEPFTYETAASITCGTDCYGTNQANITDHYLFQPGVMPNSLYSNYYCDHPTATSFTYTATHQWNNQRIYVDRQPYTNTGKQVGAFGNSQVQFSHGVSITDYSQPPTCSPIVTITNSTGSKTGGI